MSRMRALALALALTVGTASAQDFFPSRPVHLIVPYTPGTGADILARALGPHLTESWNAPVITENKAGATGSIGADFVAKSSPDGHTLLFAATSFGTTPALSRVPFDPVRSFAPVALVATSGLVLAVHPQLPARSVRELVEVAKRQPGKLHYSSPGTGGVQHLAMELLKLETGMDLVHVPYKGAGGALADAVGGHVQITVAGIQTAQPYVASGRLRALGVMSAERSAAFPGVPTLKEQGLGELVVETWYGAFAPASTPAWIVLQINRDLNLALRDAAIQALLEKQGLLPAGGPPARLGELVKQDLARWTRVVNAAGIKAN
jgi:tripartite-type tricarboxylate transporter receptor subunit TctC